MKYLKVVSVMVSCFIAAASVQAMVDPTGERDVSTRQVSAAGASSSISGVAPASEELDFVRWKRAQNLARAHEMVSYFMWSAAFELESIRQSSQVYEKAGTEMPYSDDIKQFLSGDNQEIGQHFQKYTANKERLTETISRPLQVLCDIRVLNYLAGRSWPIPSETLKEKQDALRPIIGEEGIALCEGAGYLGTGYDHVGLDEIGSCQREELTRALYDSEQEARLMETLLGVFLSDTFLYLRQVLNVSSHRFGFGDIYAAYISDYLDEGDRVGEERATPSFLALVRKAAEFSQVNMEEWVSNNKILGTLAIYYLPQNYEGEEGEFIREGFKRLLSGEQFLRMKDKERGELSDELSEVLHRVGGKVPALIEEIVGEVLNKPGDMELKGLIQDAIAASRLNPEASPDRGVSSEGAEPTN